MKILVPLLNVQKSCQVAQIWPLLKKLFFSGHSQPERPPTEVEKVTVWDVVKPYWFKRTEKISGKVSHASPSEASPRHRGAGLSEGRFVRRRRHKPDMAAPHNPRHKALRRHRKLQPFGRAKVCQHFGRGEKYSGGRLQERSQNIRSRQHFGQTLKGLEGKHNQPLQLFIEALPS